MLRAVIGLSLALAMVATSAQAAPAFSPSDWFAKAAKAVSAATNQGVDFDPWNWAQDLASPSRARAQEEQPANGDSAADAPQNGAQAGKTGRDGKKPTDKDEAREKSGPEPLPLAF
jgi:hypothetical protein